MIHLPKLILILLFIVNLAFGQNTSTVVSQDTTIKKCKLKYPSAARKNRIQGTVEIKVVFDSGCSIKEYKVIKSLGYGCDEAAIDCLINVQEKTKKEKKSKCEDGFEAVFPFNFKLE